MIFQALMEAAEADELILVDHGMCRYHYRRDDQITIHEIIVTWPRRGIGTRILEELIFRHPEATCIVARCPVNLLSNWWYAHHGFDIVGQYPEQTNYPTVYIWKRNLKSSTAGEEIDP